MKKPVRDAHGRFAEIRKAFKQPAGKPPAKVKRQPADKSPVKVKRPPAGKPPVKVKRPPAGKSPAKVKRPPAGKSPAKVKRPPAGKPPVKVKRPPAGKPPVKVKRPPAGKPPVKKRVPAEKRSRDRLGRFRKLPAKRKKRLPAKKPSVGRRPVKRRPAKGKPPIKKKRGLPPRKPPVKKKPTRKRRAPKPPAELPPIAIRSGLADTEMQGKLVALMDGVKRLEDRVDVAVQTFVNRDGTVDGELTIRNLPEEWRDVRGIRQLVAMLSRVMRSFRPFDTKPDMGGAFWCSYGIRFGPQNEVELGELAALYKRHKGMLQIGTYPTHASGTGSLQIGLAGEHVGLRSMLENLLEKRGLPPTVILIRFIWTPDGQRPGHYKGEK